MCFDSIIFVAENARERREEREKMHHHADIPGLRTDSIEAPSVIPGM
jgi:hypothetical protein